MLSPVLKVNCLFLMKMLCNRVYYDFIERKIRYVDDTPNRVTNPQYDGVPNVTDTYRYRLFFRVPWESFCYSVL